MLIYAGFEHAGFMVFKMPDNGNVDAELLEFRMLIYLNLGC